MAVSKAYLNYALPFATYLSSLKFVFIVWLITLVVGLFGCTFSVLLCLNIADAGGAVSALHYSVLDIKCDQDDFMDTAIGA